MSDPAPADPTKRYPRIPPVPFQSSTNKPIPVKTLRFASYQDIPGKAQCSSVSDERQMNRQGYTIMYAPWLRAYQVVQYQPGDHDPAPNGVLYLPESLGSWMPMPTEGQ